MTGTIVIGGPTASGKSTLAMRLAAASGGVIINADSMQLYRELRIVTARPSPADEARVPHRLYGVLAADRPGSAGSWLALAQAALDEAKAHGRPAIVVGGTGLYLHALLHGLADVPPVPAEARAAACALYRRLGGPAFHAELQARDPVMAARLAPHDRQRLIRAFEVVGATGRSLADWQADAPTRVALPQPVIGVALMPPRAEVYARIGRRLEAMVAAGALDELRALRSSASRRTCRCSRRSRCASCWPMSRAGSISRARSPAPRSRRGATPSVSSPGCATRCPS